MAFIVGAIIGGVATLAGGAMAAKGARDAAKTAAAGDERSIEFQRESRDLARGDQAPYREAGYEALDAMKSLTGLGGPQGGSTQSQNPFRGIGAAGTAVGRAINETVRRQNQYRGSSYARALGGPTAGGNIYNINEMGPENVYAGGALTRNPNPMTIDGQTGYVEPNVQGRATGGFTNEYDYGGSTLYPQPDGTVRPGAGPNRIAGPPKSYAGGVGQIPNGFQTEQFIPPNGGSGGWSGNIQSTNLGFGGYNGDLSGDPQVNQGGMLGTNAVANGTATVNPNTAGSTNINPQTGYPNENPGGVEGGYQFQTDPGYQFRFGEGMRALDRTAAKNGGLLSGGYARKAMRYGQGFASNEFSNVYNRISNIAGLGQVANNQSGQYAMNAGANMANAAGNAGYANASGYAAQGDIWGNALRSGGSYLDDVTGGWNPFKKKQTESSGWDPYTDNLSGLGG